MPETTETQGSQRAPDDHENALKLIAEVQRLLVRNGLTHRQREREIEYAIGQFFVAADMKTVERVTHYRVLIAAAERQGSRGEK